MDPLAAELRLDPGMDMGRRRVGEEGISAAG
jgi:hypothetical protein